MKACVRPRAMGSCVCARSGWNVTGKSGTMMKDCVNAMSWIIGMCGRSMRALVVGASVTSHGDVAHGLVRFIGERVLFARDRVVLRMAREAAFERAVEIGAPDTLQFVVELDRQVARFDDGAKLAADEGQVGIDAACRAGPRPAREWA